MQTKVCTACHKEKPISEFYKQKEGKFGVTSVCKDCKNKRTIEWQKTHRENCRKAQNKYRKSHKAKVAKYSHNKYIENKDEKLKYNTEYYYKNRDILLLKAKNKREKNKDYYNKKQMVRYYKNQKLISKKLKRRRDTDINYRLRLNLRHRVLEALKGNNKSKRTLELLGCSVEFLNKHLESQFADGMNWSNYGSGKNGKEAQEWHIDHIIPCFTFDLTDPKQQEQCFHYRNLRPLWAIDNLSRPKYRRMYASKY